MLILKPIVICVITLLIVIILNRFIPEFVPLILLICTVGVLIYIMPYLSSILTAINSLAFKSSNVTPFVKTTIKIVVISVVCEFATQLCKDCGQGYLSSEINLIGKIIIMSIVAPIIIQFIEFVIEMSSEI